MIVVDEASEDVMTLADAISALSTQLFQATWHAGCELSIWLAMSEEQSSWRRSADVELLQVLQLAWLRAGGWVVWDEDTDELMWLTNEEWAAVRLARMRLGEEMH